MKMVVFLIIKENDYLIKDVRLTGQPFVKNKKLDSQPHYLHPNKWERNQRFQWGKKANKNTRRTYFKHFCNWSKCIWVFLSISRKYEIIQDVLSIVTCNMKFCILKKKGHLWGRNTDKILVTGSIVE